MRWTIAAVLLVATGCSSAATSEAPTTALVAPPPSTSVAPPTTAVAPASTSIADPIPVATTATCARDLDHRHGRQHHGRRHHGREPGAGADG